VINVLNYYAPFIRELDDSHVGHSLAEAPSTKFLVLLSLSNVVRVHVLQVIKRKPCLHDGAVTIDPNKEQVGRNSS